MSSRLKKLRAMGAGELASRLAEHVRGRWERHQVARKEPPLDRLRQGLAALPPRGATWQESLLAARASTAARSFPSLDVPPTLRTLLFTRYPQEVARTLETAARVRTHELDYFGRTFRFGDPIDWHRDPLSGQRWPLVYHADVPVAGEGQPGDAKDVWELNRHQFLVDLGKAWLLTGDPAWPAQVRALVDDWMTGNPYGLGINWAGPLEVGYRGMSWLWTYWLVRDHLAHDPQFHLRWLAGFHDHGRFLYRHLELFSSPYNHLIGEAASLYVLGLMFPEFREAGRWRARGRHVLVTRLKYQFYDDGGSVEQATVYHHATLGFYLLAALLGRTNGDEFPTAVWTAIERAIEWGVHLVQPDGRLPLLGDNDDARPIRMERRDLWDFRHFQAIGASLFRRADFAFVAGRFHEDALWLLGPDGLEQFERLRATEPSFRSTRLPHSGYVVLRSSWREDADYVCFDCGEQAGGLRHDDIPSAAHGHADCLSTIVSLRGRPILVDAGFYTYARDEPWERFFRETAAHNTVRVDGRDQARHLRQMAWVEAPAATLEGFSLEPSRGWALGSHDGYLRPPTLMRHQRSVWLRDGGYVVLLDLLTGDGEHEAELAFQFAPGLTVELSDGEAKIADRATLTRVATFTWAATFPVRATVSRGEERPDGGWVATGLGVREPAPRLVLAGRFDARDARVMTVLGAGDDVPRPDLDHVSGSRPSADALPLRARA